jgi:hypothetical protein
VAPPGGLEPPTVYLEGRVEPSHSVTTSGKLSHIACSQPVITPMDRTPSDSVRPNETGMLGLLLGRAERGKRPWGAVYRPASRSVTDHDTMPICEEHCSLQLRPPSPWESALALLSVQRVIQQRLPSLLILRFVRYMG